MKKEKCTWCAESKLLLIPVFGPQVMAMGVQDFMDPSHIYVHAKGKDDERGMCEECWRESYRKSHPNNVVTVLHAPTT